MTARVLALTAVLVTVLLFQAVIGPAMAVGGVQPDLLVLVVVGLGIAEGPGTGGRFGFVGGLALDLLAGGQHLVGIDALTLLLVGYCAGLARPYLTVGVLAGQVLVGGMASGLAAVAHGLLAFLLGVTASGPISVARTAVLAGLYGAALAPIVCHMVEAVARRVPVTASPA